LEIRYGEFFEGEKEWIWRIINWKALIRSRYVSRKRRRGRRIKWQLRSRKEKGGRKIWWRKIYQLVYCWKWWRTNNSGGSSRWYWLRLLRLRRKI